MTTATKLENFNIEFVPVVQSLYPNNLHRSILNEPATKPKNKLTADRLGESDDRNNQIWCSWNALTFSRLFNPWPVHNIQNAARFTIF